MANQEQLALLEQGVAEWNKWRKNNRHEVVELSGTNLHKANLLGADLSGANLNETTLNKADLRRANLRGANMREAHLREANLSGADLCRAYFITEDLAQANYTGARFVDDQLALLTAQAEQQDNIIRSIEFAPEYHQSGLAILSYFGQVLRDKYPETKAKVTIEQDGLTVRMIIETPEGERVRIPRHPGQ